MKLIKKAQPVKVNLNDKFKAGQTIAVTTECHDGRGRYDHINHTYTVDKVNRVTIDITDKNGNTYRLDPDTVVDIRVIG
jgi:hypothetical protein